MVSKKQVSDVGKGRSVCVIGSGISGLSSAYLLQRNGFKVTLLESETTLGGHTLTDETIPGCPVDLGFQVFNRTTYGHFEKFLEELGVDSEQSDMSFALSVDDGKLEWGSHSLSSIFAQKSNLVSPSFWLMIKEVLRFGQEAPKVLDNAEYDGMTLGEYLIKHRYAKSFVDNYLLPMCAAVWSVSNKQCFDFNVQVLVRFWVNHHLLNIFTRPLWRVVKDRSRSYVQRVQADLLEGGGNVRCSSAVHAIKRDSKGVRVTLAGGEEEEYDLCVMATHSDVSLKILGSDATAEEEAVLAGIPYASNKVYLHRDPALMPRDKRVWASWNCIDSSVENKDGPSEKAVCVSYWINSLQHGIPEKEGDLFVTLNPPFKPKADSIIRELDLAHPVFSAASAEAQKRIPSIQGVNRTFFAGAWCGYGFHEDGIRAAVEVVKQLGGGLPWTPKPTAPDMSLYHRMLTSTVHKVAKGAITKGSLRVIMPDGSEQVYGTPEAASDIDNKAKLERGAQSAPCHATIKVYDLKFFERVTKDTDIGLGESFMYGEFETEDLTNMLNVMTQNVTQFNSSQGQLGLLNWLGSKVQAIAHSARANTVEGSRKNINEHYDLGNDMYRLFLDESWMYSSGVFNTAQDTLYQSQMNKLDLIINKLHLQPEHHVLEIGCGWGGFAIRAAKTTGCKVTGITISEEQFSYATELVKKEGLSDRITILFLDYRELPKQKVLYDKLVSIEMIEAVGHEHLHQYFQVIDKCLKPGGTACIQAITYKDEYYKQYCQCSDFIRRHIFPGGHLPSMGVMLEATKPTMLACTHVEDIGLHYATTLKKWHERWCEAEEEVKALGYSDQFFKMWRFYLSYCEAGFEQQFIHNYQIVWSKCPVALATNTSVSSGSAVRVETSRMLMLWCFMTGIAAGKYISTLWMVPVAVALLQVLAMGVHFVTPSSLSLSLRSSFKTAVVGLLYSLTATALLITCMSRGLLPLSLSPSSSSSSSGPCVECNVLLSLASGHAVWALFDSLTTAGGGVSSRRSRIFREAVTLACCSVALAKQLFVPYVCLALVSEMHSVCALASELASLLLPSPPPLLNSLQAVVLVVCRVGGQCALFAKVYSDRDHFSNDGAWAVALAALLSLTLQSAYQVLTAVLLRPLGHQLHTSGCANAKLKTA